MKKILIILSIFVLNGGLSLYASTYREVIKEANKLGGSGKIIAEIDFRLKMRNLNSMTLDQYALITIQAARLLQNIGDCKRSLEEIKKLEALDLTRINNDLYEIYHFTQMRQIITLCDSEFKPYLKEYIDNLKWRMPAWMYAESLAYYGKRLVFDQGFYNHEAIFYYSRALGEVLANRRYQYPTIPIHALSQALNYNYQYDLYDTITKPLIAAYDKGTLNRYHPDIFNFVVSHWVSISYRGEIEYAKNLEKLIDKGIKEYDAIPAEALVDYVFTKLFLSTYNGKPEIVWNNINNDKRIPEFIKNSAKRISLFFSILQKDSYGANFEEGEFKDLVGIGAVLRTEDYYTVVSSIVPGSAAFRDGKLKEGDRIIAVAQEDLEFESVIDTPIKKVVAMIRGKPRTKVRLKILRKTDKDDEYLELVIIRDQIKVEISDSDLNSLIDYVENINDRDIITLGYSLISSVYLKKGDYKNSFIFLKKYINQLSNSTNKNISKSFALRHNLNIFQQISIEKFVQVISFLPTTHNAISDREKYYFTQKVIEVLNNTLTPASITQSSNNPNLYERLHKSSKLLFNVFSQQIKSKIKEVKIGSGPAPKDTNDTDWNGRFVGLVHLQYLINKTISKHSKYIKKPLIEDFESLISNTIGDNSAIFSVATTKDYVFQTCYSNGSYFTEIQKNFGKLSDGIKIFRKSVDPTTNRTNFFDFKLANIFYNKLFSLLEKCTQGEKHIYIYLDPNLYNLPINALLTKPSNSLKNDNWFALKYDYTILPYLGLLEKSFPKRELKSYIGLGNPDYKNNSSDNYTFVDIDDLVVTRGGRGFSKLENLEPLPSTEDEINESGSLFERKIVLLGKNATEENFRRIDHKNYDIVHFATHGLVTGEIDALKQPGLVLSYPDKPVNFLNDGYLSSGDISELELDGQLVILSACKTAVDDGAASYIGLSELSNSFIDAGAKKIIVSQWPIVSETSTVFMNEYFNNIIISNNKNALSSTIQNFTKNSKYTHPKYWAPFIPIGKQWDSSGKKDQRFQTISTTNFGDDKFVDEFRSSIKIGDQVFATVTSGSLSKNKSHLEPYLLKYDLNGKFVSKHFLGKLWGPHILGQHNKKIYLGGYNFRRYKNKLTDTTSLLGSFNLENNTFEGIIDEINLVNSNHNEILGESIVGDNLYLIVGSSNRWGEKLDFAASYHLIKYDLMNKSKKVYNFPVNKTNRIPTQGYAYYKSLIFSENDNINIFINVERETDKNKLFYNRFSEHYIFVNDELVLQKEYKNRFFSKYLSKEKILLGYTFDEIGDSIRSYHYMIYKALESADIAFFTFKENEIKLHDVLEIPNSQNFKDFIKMGDNYLMLGRTATQLSWDFDENKKNNDWGNHDYINLMNLDFQKNKTFDPFLLLFDKSFQYIDSVVYPDRIFATINSVIKIDKEHYMLFKEYKGSKSVVTINKL